MNVIYYEVHVTIEPVFEEDRLRELKDIASSEGFSIAPLFMQKRKEDTPERNKNDAFMTAHSLRYPEALQKMVSLIDSLKKSEFKVWRYKIEQVPIDSRYSDVLHLLDRADPKTLRVLNEPKPYPTTEGMAHPERYSWREDTSRPA